MEKNNVHRISDCNVKISSNESIERLATEHTVKKRSRVKIKISSESSSSICTIINSKDFVNTTPSPKKVVTKLNEHKENVSYFYKLCIQSFFVL